MAEGLAVVSAIASIAHLVELATKIHQRLATYRDKSNHLPESLQQIGNQLPLLLDSLSKTKHDIGAGVISNDTEKALLPVINGCKQQIDSLGAILDNLLPLPSDSRPERVKKAFSSINQESKVVRMASCLGSYIQTLIFYHCAVRSTLNTLKDDKLVNIREWLSAPDPSTNYEKGLELRQEGTGLWFLESEQYIKWKAEASAFIWLHGIPGCGKTVLSSTILEDVFQYCKTDPGKVVAYFYFDFKDVQKQSSELMIKSLVTQLSHQCIRIPHELDILFTSSDKGQRQPSTKALLLALKEMIQEFPATYVVLDALDECTDRDQLMGRIETIASWHLMNLRLIVTSRKEREIENSLEKLVDRSNIIPLESALIDEDIQKYVRHRISEDRKLKKWRDGDMQREIEVTLMKGAHGMFRWAVCQLDSLGQCVNKAMLRQTLRQLPATLDETYERILCAVDSVHSIYALRILRWLAFSLRPLSLYEIAEVVAVDPENDPAFDRDEVLEDPLDAIEICGSLLTVTVTLKNTYFVTKERVISFAHYSVKEYLTSERIQMGPANMYSLQACASHNFIGNACIGYLLQFHDAESFSEKTIAYHNLAQYSAEFWVRHAKSSASTEASTQRLAMKLFSARNGAYLNWVRIHDLDSPWDGLQLKKQVTDLPFPLYYASLAGLSEYVRCLLCDTGTDVNAKGGLGTALLAASKNGYEAIVKLLLDAGADVDKKDEYGSTALLAASEHGYESIVKLLLDAGADVDKKHEYGSTALLAASEHGYESIVKLLLDAGADVDAQRKQYGGTALLAASERGYESIVKLLLDAGADVDAQRKQYGGTALLAASERGYESIVKLLLDAGADVNRQDQYNGTALQQASKNDHEAVVKLLLDAGADVDGKDEFGRTALQMASGNGHEVVVKLLLNAGADIDAQRKQYGGTALLAASEHGYESIVKLLLDAGADVNRQDQYNGTALQQASKNDHEAVVKLLLDAGADVDGKDEFGRTALQMASGNGHEVVVKLLLNAGADIDAQRKQYGGTALQMASEKGREAVVKLLLDAGANIDEKDEYYIIALKAASNYGHEAVVKLLLDAGADIDGKDEYGSTALQMASKNGHEPVVKLLLDAGADLNGKNEYGSTALLVASIYGHEAVVKLLLNAGADVDGKDEYGSTALLVASIYGHEAVVKLLLNAGANVDVQSEEYETAMQAASRYGHETVVKLLLNAGADADAQRKYNDGTALLAASKNGYKAIVKLLLDAGADVDGKDEYDDTALMAASENGYETIIKLLLNAGADINAQNKHNGGTALLAASKNGYEAIVKLLLDASADVDGKDEYGNTALQKASIYGHEAVVKLLLNAGANVDVQSEEYETAMQAASRYGHETVVKQLLNAGADIDAKTKNGITALWMASIYGHEPVVKLLLDAGADIDAQDNSGNTALQAASRIGYRAIVNLLLDARRSDRYAGDITLAENVG